MMKATMSMRGKIIMKMKDTIIRVLIPTFGLIPTT